MPDTLPDRRGRPAWRRAEFPPSPAAAVEHTATAALFATLADVAE